MKLKKIASLMLAGIMAVSMLAACDGQTINNGNNGEENGPTTTDLSGEVLNILNDRDVTVPEYVTFKNDTALDAALKFAAGSAGVMDVMPEYLASDTLVGVADDVYNNLANKVGVTKSSNGGRIWNTNIGSYAELVYAEKQDSYKIDDAVSVHMAAVSGAIGEDNVKEQIADYIETLPEYLYSIIPTDDGEEELGGNFVHNYTVSISTYTKTVNSSVGGALDMEEGIRLPGTTTTVNGIFGGANDPSVTFVAIQVVRTSTHQGA